MNSFLPNLLPIIVNVFNDSESAVADQQVNIPTSHGSKICECGCDEAICLNTWQQLCIECNAVRSTKATIEEYEA